MKEKENYVIVSKVVEEKFPINDGYTVEQVKDELRDRIARHCDCLDYDNSEVISEDYTYFGLAWEKIVFNGKEID